MFVSISGSDSFLTSGSLSFFSRLISPQQHWKWGIESLGWRLGLSDAISSKGSRNIPIHFFFFHFMHASVTEKSSDHKENYNLSRLSEYSLLIHVLLYWILIVRGKAICIRKEERKSPGGNHCETKAPRRKGKESAQQSEGDPGWWRCCRLCCGSWWDIQCRWRYALQTVGATWQNAERVGNLWRSSTSPRE